MSILIPTGAKIAFRVALALVILLVVVLWPRPEPSYMGRGVSAWIQDLEWVTSNLNTESKRARHEAAAKAIRQLGPGVVPILLSRLRSDDSKWEPMREHWGKMLGVRRAPVREENARIFAAIEAVGAEARPAIPEMMRLLESGKIPAMALVLSETFGEESLPYLRRGVTNAAARVRAASVTGIRMLGVKGKPANASIISALNDADVKVRVQAAVALGRLRGEARETVPALTAALNDPDSEVQQEAARALGKYGSEAVEAVASLRKLASRPYQLGTYATEALEQIEKTNVGLVHPSN